VELALQQKSLTAACPRAQQPPAASRHTPARRCSRQRASFVWEGVITNWQRKLSIDRRNCPGRANCSTRCPSDRGTARTGECLRQQLAGAERQLIAPADDSMGFKTPVYLSARVTVAPIDHRVCFQIR
jgi:hypothetical protein